jgi:hypothetical protein
MENEQQEYDPVRPFVTQVPCYRNGDVVNYSPIFDIETVVRHRPYFRLPDDGVNPVDALCHLFLPDRLLQKMVDSTNAYASERLPPERVKPVRKADVLKFFATIYYMGVLRMPSKEDYFPTSYQLNREDMPDVWLRIFG